MQHNTKMIKNEKKKKVTRSIDRWIFFSGLLLEAGCKDKDLNLSLKFKGRAQTN
jgi:hypothetical protein